MAHAYQVGQPTKSALVIYQDMRERQVLVETLSKLGWSVSQATNRSDGLPMLFQIHPHMVVLEIGNNEDASWDIFSSIRLITDIPIILVSNHPLRYKPFSSDSTNVHVLSPVSIPKLTGLAKTYFKSQVEHPRHMTKPTKQCDTLMLHELQSRQIKHIDQALLQVGNFGEVRLIFRNGQLRSVLKMTTETLSPQSGSSDDFVPPVTGLKKELEHAK